MEKGEGNGDAGFLLCVRGISIAAGLLFFLYAMKYYASMYLALRSHNAMVNNHNYFYNLLAQQPAQK